MDMQEDIKKAINENLPAQVGEVLKKRLAQADRDKDQLFLSTKESTSLRKINDRLIDDVEALKGKVKKQVELDTREAEIILKEKLMGLKEIHSNERVKDLKDIVSLVFANNKYKYHEFGDIPVKDPGGYTMSGQFNKTVEKEG